MIRNQSIIDWKEGLEPQAELIGQLTHPEIYKEYIKFKEKIKEKKEKGEPINVTIKTEKGVSAYSQTEHKYDPNKGLIDANGNIIIPKEKFAKMMHFEQGVPISF